MLYFLFHTVILGYHVNEILAEGEPHISRTVASRISVPWMECVRLCIGEVEYFDRFCFRSVL